MFRFQRVESEFTEKSKKALVCFRNGVTFAARKRQSAGFSVSS